MRKIIQVPSLARDGDSFIIFRTTNPIQSESHAGLDIHVEKNLQCTDHRACSPFPSFAVNSQSVLTIISHKQESIHTKLKHNSE